MGGCLLAIIALSEISYNSIFFRVYGARSYAAFGSKMWFFIVSVRCFYEIASVMIGTLVFIAFMRLKIVLPLAHWGRYTLFIYFAHGLIAVLIWQFEWSLTKGIVLTLVLLPLITWLATTPVANFFMFPISSLRNTIQHFILKTKN